MGLRGITNKRYMSEASGSDKTFSFRWLGKNNNTIHLFESAIDLLSYATFEKIKGHNWYDNTLIALAGVYQPAEEIKDSKLPIALKSYLEKNKNVEEIVLHFDNDKTGRLASEVLKTILPNKYKVIDSPPKVGKDYNDFLLYFKRNNREKER